MSDSDCGDEGCDDYGYTYSNDDCGDQENFSDNDGCFYDYDDQNEPEDSDCYQSDQYECNGEGEEHCEYDPEAEDTSSGRNDADEGSESDGSSTSGEVGHSSPEYGYYEEDGNNEDDNEHETAYCEDQEQYPDYQSNASYNSYGEPVVYTDGSCLGNGQQGASGGIGVHWGNNHPMNVSEPLYGRQTNNCAEIKAVTHAINQAREQNIRDVEVRTDSEFVVKATSKWMGNWKDNGWKTSTGQPVKNRGEFEDLDRAMSDMNVRLTYVPGHSGDYGNECAHRLASDGAYSKRGYRK